MAARSAVRPWIGAAIDIGSNSIHLLVAELRDGELRTMLDRSELLGLGPLVDREGHIPAAEQHTAVRALADYVVAARALGAETVTLLGTEPLRRASNRSRVRDAVETATGLPLHVLSHDMEAELTLLGVLEGRPPGEPTLLIDIGGGSSEVILVAPGEDPVVGALPTGSARLTASFVRHDPPREEEVESLRREAALLVAAMPAGEPVRGIVTGGSGRNLVLLSGSEPIDRSAVAVAFARSVAYPASDLVGRYGLRERRALQIAAGAALVEAVMTRYALEHLEVSDASLREGALRAASLVGDTWPECLNELVSARR